MTGIRRQDGSAFTLESVRIVLGARARLWALVADSFDAELPGAESLLSSAPESLALAWGAGGVLPAPASGIERAVVTVTLLPLGRRTRVVLVVAGLAEPDATALAVRLDARLLALGRSARG